MFNLYGDQSESVLLKDGIEVITPDKNVLDKEETSDNLVCPVKGCGKKTNNSSSLRLHVIKAHGEGGTRTLNRGSKKMYACPVKGCPRHVNDSSQNFFSIMYLLRRHYLNVHAKKKHVCSKCGKCFGRIYTKENHEKSCRKLFFCSCGAYYTTKNAVQVHVNRRGKGHSMKPDPDEEKERGQNPMIVTPTQLVNIPCMLYIPKASSPLPPGPQPSTNGPPTNVSDLKRNIEIQPKKPPVLSRFEKTMRYLSSAEAQEVLSNSPLMHCLIRQKQEQKGLCEKACAKSGKQCKHKTLKLPSLLDECYSIHPRKRKERKTTQRSSGIEKNISESKETLSFDQGNLDLYSHAAPPSTSSDICNQSTSSNDLLKDITPVEAASQKVGVDYSSIEVLETSDFSAQCQIPSVSSIFQPSEQIAGMDIETQTEDFDTWFNSITSSDMETQTNVSIQTQIDRCVRDVGVPTDSLNKAVQWDDLLNGDAWDREQDLFSSSFTNTSTQTATESPPLFLSNESNVKQSSGTQTMSELVDFQADTGFSNDVSGDINDKDIVLATNENSMEAISMSFGTQTVLEEFDPSQAQEMLSLGTQTVFDGNFFSSSGTQTVNFLDSELAENSINAKTIETQTAISFADLFDPAFLDEYINNDRIMANSETQTFDVVEDEFASKTSVTIETQTGS